MFQLLRLSPEHKSSNSFRAALSLALPVRMLVVLRLFRRCRRAIRLPVVLVVVDCFARVVLLMVHLLTLLRCQPAAVGLPVVAHFVIYVPFALLQVLGFMGSQLSGLRAVADARLLIRFARVDLAHRGCGWS